MSLKLPKTTEYFDVHSGIAPYIQCDSSNLWGLSLLFHWSPFLFHKVQKQKKCLWIKIWITPTWYAKRKQTLSLWRDGPAYIPWFIQSKQVTAFVLLCNLLGWTIRNQLFSTFLCLNCKVELKLIFLQCSLFNKKKTFVKLHNNYLTCSS